MKRGECAIQQFGQQISFPKRALQSGWRRFTWQCWKKEKDGMSMRLNDRNQISCLGGVIFFGPWLGFLYNYIGICIGSLAAFGISRMMGRPVLHKMFSEKLIQKYDSWTEKDSRFLKLFTLAIFFPVAPDDFLCYLAGTTKMTWKQFSLVILLGKPCSIALYSLGLTTAFRTIFSV